VKTSLLQAFAIVSALFLIAPAASAQIVDGEAEVDSTNPDQNVLVSVLVTEDSSTVNATASGELVNRCVNVTIPSGGAPGVPSP